jgi:hypothetical protein
MLNIKRKPHDYRETVQRGNAVNITATTPKKIAKLVHAEARSENKTVSQFIRDLLSDRYKHIVR